MKQAASFALLQEEQLVIRRRKILFKLARLFFRVYGMCPVCNWALEFKS